MKTKHIFALVACSSPAAPIKRNLAIEFITTVSKDAKCSNWDARS